MGFKNYGLLVFGLCEEKKVGKGLSKPTNQMSLSQNAKKRRVQRTKQSKRIWCLCWNFESVFFVFGGWLTFLSSLPFTFTFMVFVFGIFCSYIIPLFGFCLSHFPFFFPLLSSFLIKYVSLHLVGSSPFLGSPHSLPTISYYFNLQRLIYIITVLSIILVCW